MNKAKRAGLLQSLTIASAALIILCSCSAALINTAAHGIFPQQETNLGQQNYAVADYLIQQAKAFIDPDDLLLAEALTDREQPGMSSKLSTIIPEQIGIRLSQLGYRVDLSKVSTAADTNYLKPSIAGGEKPDFVISGSYTRRRIEMDVNMRIIDIKARRVIAAHDYIVPLTREMNDMARPKPKIERINAYDGPDSGPGR